MDPNFEIIKAFALLNNIKITKKQEKKIERQLKKFAEYGLLIKKAHFRSNFSYGLLKIGNQILSLSRYNKVYEPSLSESKHAKPGDLVIDGAVFKFYPAISELRFIDKLFSSASSIIVKDSSELCQKILSKLTGMHRFTRSEYKIVQEFFGVNPKAFEEHQMDWSVCRISKVFEHKNTRYYFYETPSYPQKARIRFSTVAANDPKYNYIDEGRYYHDNIFFEMDIPPGQITQSTCNELSSTIGSGAALVTRDIFERFLKQKENKEQEEKLKKEYENKFRKKMLKGFNFHGIFFSKSSITHGNRKLMVFGESLEKFIQTKVDFEEKPTFDKIAESFIHYLYYEQECKKIQLGIHVLEIEKIGSWRIGAVNKIKVGNICFETLLKHIYSIKESNRLEEFLRDASNYGFNIAKILKKDVYFKISQGEKKVYLKLKIVKKGDGLEIITEEDRLPVCKTSKLDAFLESSEGNITSMQFIRYLIEDEKKSSQTALNFLKCALRAYENAEKKSKKYLLGAIKETKARKSSIMLDGKKVAGFKVKGKLASYIVTDDAKVYRIPSQKYVCIYDPKTNMFVNDTIANRLYALKDDIGFSETVHTLKANA